MGLCITNDREGALLRNFCKDMGVWQEWDSCRSVRQKMKDGGGGGGEGKRHQYKDWSV